jgi:hypothetical protein
MEKYVCPNTPYHYSKTFSMAISMVGATVGMVTANHPETTAVGTMETDNMIHMDRINAPSTRKSCQRVLRNRQNKRLAILIAVGLLVLSSIFLVCVVWLAVRVIGLAAPLFVDIEKNGLKGLVDTIVTSLTTIWQGSGK